MLKVEVPQGYRCPLCPDHRDSVFFNSKIVGAPVCQGCHIEISHFIEQDERPHDRLLDRLEEVTGLTFAEYKKIGYKETIEEFERRLDSSIVAHEAALEMSVTGRSLTEVIKGWTEIIAYYRSELAKIS